MTRRRRWAASSSWSCRQPEQQMVKCGVRPFNGCSINRSFSYPAALFIMGLVWVASWNSNQTDLVTNYQNFIFEKKNIDKWNVIDFYEYQRFDLNTSVLLLCILYIIHWPLSFLTRGIELASRISKEALSFFFFLCPGGYFLHNSASNISSATLSDP